MVGTKVSAEMVFRYSVAVVAATLPPVAMVGLPVSGAMLLPRAVPDMLFRSPVPRIISPLLLSMLLLAVIVLSFGMLWLLGPLLQPLLLLSVLFVLFLPLPLSVLWLRVLRVLNPLVIFLRPLLLPGILPLLVVALLLLGPRLLPPVPLRFITVLFFAMLLVLCIGWTRENE